MAKKNKSINYEEALHEIQKIQEELESGEVPLNEMRSKVERATELIKLCKATLRNTEEGLQQLLAETD